MTRLSRIHPYPGMIADKLAVEIASEYVKPGDKLLDPFCGTGRTLVAAAERGASAVGIDINPLAVLISIAKTSNPNRGTLHRLSTRFLTDIVEAPAIDYNFEQRRTVQWFSRKATRQLSALVWYINKLYLTDANLALVAAVLSATARDVSFCRKDQWKLHRMAPQERSAFHPCAWRIFLARLQYVLSEIDKGLFLNAPCHVLLGDARNLSQILPENAFDLLFTSPPYGDSQTTVQYGGISSLSLGVIRHLERLPISIQASQTIERDCLGGNFRKGAEDVPFGLRRYWRGDDTSNARARTISFLNDLFRCCQQFSTKIKRKGHVVFVVGRRTVGGDQLLLDKFVRETMSECKFELKVAKKRVIAGKMTPYRIHRSGNTIGPLNPTTAHVATMREEYVLIFRRL